MRRILFVVALVLGAVAVASAATAPYRTDAQLIALADRVVRGRVIDTVVERAPSGTIRTRTRLAVIEDFSGGAEATMTVYELGGRLPDGRELWLPGVPRFVRGEEVVLCLQRTAEGFRTVSLGFSAFHVVDAAGVRQLTRFGGVGIVGGSTAPAATPDGRGLDDFRREATAVRRVASRQVQTDAEASAAVAAAAPVTEPFTLLGSGYRWPQADDGTPVQWFRNTLNPSPIQNGDTDTEIRTALDGWTLPTNGSIILTFAGTRFQTPGTTPGQDPYCTAENLGVGMITFGDPLNELPSGVLAIGGGCSDGVTHVLNGRTFQRFSHGLVVMNDTLSGFTSPPNITRILEHEVGHGIGLGHSELGPTNIMHPSCCQDVTPVPPAIGFDDRAGLEFLYPSDVLPCSYTLGPPTTTLGPMGGEAVVTVTASRPNCSWTMTSTAPWIRLVDSAASVGTTTVRLAVLPWLGSTAARTGTLTVSTATATVVQGADADADGDQLSDAWETFYGLNPASSVGADGASGDPDNDGISNAAELAGGTHPRGTIRRYLAEGAVNAFFDTEVALFTPLGSQVSVLLRIQPDAGPEIAWPVRLQARTPRTVLSSLFKALTTGSFAIAIEADALIVVDRTMHWDASGYGAHTESAVSAPSTTWYLAEGSTSGPFALFYLLQNPGSTATQVTVRFLRPAPLPPIDRTYALAARARLTLPVDTVAPELASTDVSGVVTSAQPIIVERSMYLDQAGRPFSAGHESAGVTALATEWFLAEGATGSFFDLFVLIANPGTQDAVVEVQYLLPSGAAPLTKQYVVRAQSRFTIYVDDEQIPAGSGQRPLASTAVATRVRSTNGAPIIVERAMWWPQPAWYEAHNAPATNTTAFKWYMAAGMSGGPTNAETYVLIANTEPVAVEATVLIHLEDGSSYSSDLVLPPNSRTNVAVGATFPEALGRRYAITVTSFGGPMRLVVERATYESPGGVTWAAGGAAVATPFVP